MSAYMNDRELAVRLIKEADGYPHSLAFLIVGIPEVQQRMLRIMCPEVAYMHEAIAVTENTQGVEASKPTVVKP